MTHSNHSFRRTSPLLYCAVLIAGFTLLSPRRAQAITTAQATQAVPPQVNQILTQIDRAAPGIHTVTADSTSDQYVALVDDHTIETGKLYYRKTSAGPEMALDIQKPARKVFIYRNNTGWMYLPDAHQVQKFDLSKNRSLVEQFLLLGLGGSGHALLRSFRITYGGETNLNGIPTVELVLTPLRPDLARNISQIQIWYNRRTWVALQQKFLQPGGDYRLLRYTGMHINGEVSNKVFDTRFPGATVITPQR